MRTRGWLVAIVMVAGGCEGPPVDELPRANTTTLFKPYVALPVGSHAAGVAVGDLDGDGRNDVAVTTTFYFDPPNDNSLHVFLQGSDGSLRPRVKYALGQRPESIDIGDVNGDGRADVVVGNFDGSSIGVLRQNAAGGLDAMVTYPTVNSLSVKIGDFNDDGRMDIVGINWGARGDGVDLFLQNADGTLAAPVTYHVSHGGYDEVDVGDLDGDGRTDIVVMSGQGLGANLGVLLQTAAGTMAAPVYYTVGSGVLTHGVAVGDVSGDGLSDVVVSYGGNTPSSFIARLLQNGTGTLDAATSSTSYDIPEPVILADVDGDGKKDVVVAHGGWNEVGVYRQQAAGALASEELYPIPYASHYQPQGLAAGDVNGDGLADLVLADYNNGLVVLSHVDDVPPVVAVTGPAPGAHFAGVPLDVTWTASDNAALGGFDVTVSTNGGASYGPLCMGLPAAARSCSWASPGPAAADVRLRVLARDAAGNQAPSETAISLVAPAVTVTGPASSVLIGTSAPITWTSNLPPSDTVKIELSRDGGSSYELLAASAPNGGSFAWTATGPATSAARIRVTWNGGPGGVAVGAAFSLDALTVTVHAPQAGGSWMIGTGRTIVWSTNVSTGDTFRVEVSRDGGATYELLAAAAPASGFFGFQPWIVNGPPSTTARVRVSWNGGPGVGISEAFAIVLPVVTVTAPAAGTSRLIGTTADITWTTNVDPEETVKIELSRDGGASYELLAAAAPSFHGFSWTATGPATTNAVVRVTWNGGPDGVGTSGPFSLVAPQVNVSAPSSWVIGTAASVTWTDNLPPSDTMKVELTRDGGASYEVLAAAAPNSGSFGWTATAPASTNARVRVTWNGGPGGVGTSGAFAIAAPVATVTVPNTAVEWTVGTNKTITWTHNLGVGAPFSLDVSRDGGATWSQIAASVASAGPTSASFVWNVTAPRTHKARIRVTSTSLPAATDASNVNFTIR